MSDHIDSSFAWSQFKFAIAVLISGTVFLATLFQLWKLRSTGSEDGGAGPADEQRKNQCATRKKRRQVVAVAYLISIGSSFAVCRAVVALAILTASSQRNYNRLLCASVGVSIGTKVLLLTSFTGIKRLIVPAKASAPTRWLFLLGDWLQVLVLFALGLAAWGISLDV